MTWKETCLMDEKIKFISAHLSNKFNISELCRRFDISRKTAYKWLNRYDTEGVDGLKDRSKANHVSHNATPNDIVAQLLEIKHQYPLWGPKKINYYLVKHKPAILWPAISTIGEILKKHGLTKCRKFRRHVPPYTKPFNECDAPNKVWSADFKGQFRVGEQGYCYPLTITDNYSRFLLMCKGLSRPTGENVKKWFERAFIEYGLPEAIRTDNGTPFSSVSVAGLSELSVWWVKLGITPERIEPGNPQQNGRHERMHRTLKQATANPPKKSFSAQQRAFNNFIEEYNTQRPHEALAGHCPDEFYKVSNREYPFVIPEFEYPNSYYVRRIKSGGILQFCGGQFFIGEPLAREIVGLEPIDNEIYQIYFHHIKVGIFDARKREIKRTI